MNWMTRIVEKRRRKKGLPVGPGQMVGIEIVPSIDELANESLTEAHMTRKLAFAIRKTADDLCHHPGKRYGYEEWVDFTRLIRFTKMDLDELEYDEDQEGVVEWDWLDENSPMLSEQSESEWILDRLCESLLRLLKKNNLGSVPEQEPSISFAHFSWGETGDDKADRKDAAPPDKPDEPTVLQERRRRASGADAVLTFFTGARRGAHAYATDEPIWSKKALEKKHHHRRKSSSEKRRGPFSRLHHNGPTGAIGGGRGGAGVRTLKARKFVGNDTSR